ncbi:hypothetical protein [Streptomyces sp. NPDC002676]
MPRAAALILVYPWDGTSGETLEERWSLPALTQRDAAATGLGDVPTVGAEPAPEAYDAFMRSHTE